MTLLQFLLHTHIDVVPKPAGAPEDYYGAMFNDVLLRHPEAPPQKPRGLFDTELDAIKKTVGTLQRDGEKRLYLAAASGLDLDHHVAYFRGPHVGSHPNMLFKRSIFQTEQPVVLCITESKLQKRFIVGKCYPVFGPDYSWDDACRERPIALCIGYALEEYDEGADKVARKKADLIRRLAHKLRGFDLNYASVEFNNRGAAIVANPAFKKFLPRE